MGLPFEDRVAAGQELAEALASYRSRKNLVVLALPRGGVPVAARIAAALGATLDLMIVRKLGLPGHEELAMGAIASGGIRVMNNDVVHYHHVQAAAIDQVAAAEQRELERREHAYRGDRPRPKLANQCVILVDDGLATGATMRAAIDAVRRQRPSAIVVAIPVAPAETVAQLRQRVDDVVCLATPAPFYAIGQWYARFDQTSDEEVEALLKQAWQARNTAKRDGVDSSVVEPGEWREFCRRFGLEHRGWRVSLGEVFTRLLDTDPEHARANQQRRIEGAALLEVAYEPQSHLVRVTYEQDGGSHSWDIPQPVQIIQETVHAAHKGLRVDEKSGKSALLEFRVAAAPESVDGLAEWER